LHSKESQIIAQKRKKVNRFRGDTNDPTPCFTRAFLFSAFSGGL